jgi:hypothetical protein
MEDIKFEKIVLGGLTYNKVELIDVDLDDLMAYNSVDENIDFLKKSGIKSILIPDPSQEKTIDKRVKAELGEIGRRISDERKKAMDRISLAMDGQFCITMIFGSGTQRKEFLLKSGLGDVTTRFVDGRKVAAGLKIELTPVDYRPIIKAKKS